MSIVKNWQIIASLAEFGNWEGVESPELDITTDDYYPPGSRTPVKLPSIGKFSDISLTRAHDPTVDKRVEDWVKRVLNGTDGPRNLTVSVLNDQSVVQMTRTYVVKPIGYKPPAGKSGDSAISEFSLKLAVEAQQ